MINLPKKKGGQISLPAASCSLERIWKTKDNGGHKVQRNWSETSHHTHEISQVRRRDEEGPTYQIWKSKDWNEMQVASPEGSGRSVTMSGQNRETKGEDTITGWNQTAQVFKSLFWHINQELEHRGLVFLYWLVNERLDMTWQPRKPTLSWLIQHKGGITEDREPPPCALDITIW